MYFKAQKINVSLLAIAATAFFITLWKNAQYILTVDLLELHHTWLLQIKIPEIAPLDDHSKQILQTKITGGCINEQSKTVSEIENLLKKNTASYAIKVSNLSFLLVQAIHQASAEFHQRKMLCPRTRSDRCVVFLSHPLIECAWGVLHLSEPMVIRRNNV